MVTTSVLVASMAMISIIAIVMMISIIAMVMISIIAIVMMISIITMVMIYITYRHSYTHGSVLSTSSWCFYIPGMEQ